MWTPETEECGSSPAGGDRPASCSRREFVKRAASAAFGAYTARPLISALAAQRVATSRDVHWLSEVLEPPAAATDPPRPLAPLLLDRKGRTITTLHEWRGRRAELDQT